jgi:uncharacterized protein YcbK (DUF882 family)
VADEARLSASSGVEKRKQMWLCGPARNDTLTATDIPMSMPPYPLSPQEGAAERPRLGRRGFLRGALALSAAALVPARLLADERAERVLSFAHTHTGERLSVAYFAEGRYLQDGLERLRSFLRDFRTGDEHAIDPALFDLLHDLRLATATRGPFHVISGYRSPATNAMLREHSAGVAGGSLHVQGRAIDVRLGDVRTNVLRDAALELQRGGVGYYPVSDFVHVDTGRVRRW